MTPDRDDDPILDACLEEILGGRVPPDLTPRILSALAAPRNPAGQLAAPIAELPLIRPAAPVANRPFWSKQTVHRWIVSLAASAICLAFTIAIIGMMRSNSSWVAEAPPDPAQPESSVAPQAPQRQLAARPAGPRESPASVENAVEPPSLPTAEPVLETIPEAQVANNSQTSPSLKRAPEIDWAAVRKNRGLTPAPDGQIVSYVNSELVRSWKAAGVKPAPPLTDAQWCERVFATLAGRGPTAEELKRFLDSKSPDRRERQVTQLLEESDYVNEYARHWSAIWTRVLWGTGAYQGGAAASRDDLANYVRDALEANKPYDEFTFDLLTASGSARPGATDYNPAVNFLLNGLDAAATRVTTRVARVFLGHELQCAQCHTHPAQGWTQEEFWSLNAFFRGIKAESQGGVPSLVCAEALSPRSGSPPGRGVFYETPEGLMKTAQPRFFAGEAIPLTGQLAGNDRRFELARQVVESDRLAKATVNRVWAQLFGFGFVRPVDDLGPSAEPSQPEVFDRLANEFAAHNYDLRRLLHWSVLSEAFNRSSAVTDLASKDMPEEGELALFSRSYQRPAQAAEAFRTLAQAAKTRRSGPSDSDIKKARVDWLSQFSRSTSAGKKLAPPKGKPAPTILTAGKLQRTTTPREASFVKKIAASKLPFEKQVEHLFLAAVSREPTRREARAAADILTSASGDQAAALADVWWALVSSSESTLDR